MRYLLLRLKRFCGYIVGIIFFISGILKLMDPVGAGLVMNEYYKFMHLEFLSFSAKFLGVTFAFGEAVIGAALATGVWRQIIAKCALALQTFFTLITLSLVIFKPEMDCGCFGEAIHLTHAQTFVKNVILLALIATYTFPLKQLGQTIRRKYVSFSILTVSLAAFTVYSWIYIPLTDFTAYKSGAELLSSSSIYTDDLYEAVFTYEKDGRTQEFSLDALPDSTWTFVGTQTRTKTDRDRSYIGLSFYKPGTEEYADSLACSGKVMIVSVYDTDMKENKWKGIESFILNAEAAGFKTILICTSSEGIPGALADIAFISDYKTIISLNRSNGGVTYFSNGTLLRKWARINTPDMQELEKTFKDDTTEVAMSYNSKGSLEFQGFLLYVFAVLLLL